MRGRSSGFPESLLLLEDVEVSSNVGKRPQRLSCRLEVLLRGSHRALGSGGN